VQPKGNIWDMINNTNINIIDKRLLEQFFKMTPSEIHAMGFLNYQIPKPDCMARLVLDRLIEKHNYSIDDLICYARKMKFRFKDDSVRRNIEYEIGRQKNFCEKICKKISSKTISESFLENDIENIFSNQKLDEIEKLNLVKSRIGQGDFRQKLIKYWKGKCSATGFDEIELLIASHIKPWSESNNTERLDQFNGLLLIPNLDKVFDSGFITFDDSGKVMISALLKNPEKLGIYPDMKIILTPKHELFMKFHRNKVFKK
jgi:hypothetical protein